MFVSPTRSTGPVSARSEGGRWLPEESCFPFQKAVSLLSIQYSPEFRVTGPSFMDTVMTRVCISATADLMSLLVYTRLRFSIQPDMNPNEQ